MHGKRLAVVAALVLVIAILSTVCIIAATAPKPAAKPAPTQEKNLAKFNAAPANTAVAIVGGQKITKAELMTVLWDWMAPSTLDEYINYKVVTVALKKRGIQITQADLTKKMEEVKKTLPPGETLDSMMQKMKYPMARFKSGMTIQVGIEKIIEKENAPTAAEYADYLKARHILINLPRPKPDAKPEETAQAETDAKAKADKVLAEVKGGKTFDAAAKEYSEDAGTKEKGGDLGWFTKGRMVPEFSDAAFKLKPGEISDPVKSPYGYHIIKVEKTGAAATGADKTELKKMILQSKMQMLMRSTFEKLKEEAKIQNLVSPALPEAARPMMPGAAPPRPVPTPAPATARPAPPKPAPAPATPAPEKPAAEDTAPPPAPPAPDATPAPAN